MQHYSDASNETKRSAASVWDGGSHIVRAPAQVQSKAAPTKAKRTVVRVNKSALGTSQRKMPAAAQRLRKRLLKLRLLGIKLPILAEALGVSYSGVHGFFTGELNPDPERLTEYHAALTKWCKRVGAA